VDYGDKEIGARDLLAVFWRALLIQASWSFERMQSLGFAYAIEPALRKLYPDRAEYEVRLRLHQEYFNTQPYLASFILGAAVRLEQDRVSGRNTAADVSGLKDALMSPLGALGDSFFWGALKPLAAVTATALLMTGSSWAPLLFLVLYNVWHVGIRASALFLGYTNSGDAVDLLGRYRFTKRAKLFKVISLSVLGGMLGMLPAWRPEFRPAVNVGDLFLALSGLAITLVLAEIARKGGSPVKIMLGLAAFCLALAYAGVI
jgi:PTS system mannose-specific IID component